MKTKNKDKALLITIIAIIIVALSIGGVVLFKYFSSSSNNYQKAISSENSQDICTTPQGYTDEQWKDHMSHHPDRYAQCLS